MAVWLLPGQGAQMPAMGAGLVGSRAFDQVLGIGSEVLGTDLRYLALEAGKDEVDDAFNAQVLTAAVSMACGSELLERGLRPSAVVGFSLGQISALSVSGMLSLEDTFSLLSVRAAAMAQACEQTPGAMLALVGYSLEEAESLVNEAAEGAVLVVANHNCPGQKVVSGDAAAIERCQELVKSRGGKCIPLNTAGGFHTPLMHKAAESVREACNRMTFCEPKFPVICNTDGHPFEIAQASDRLARQVESPVLFEESISLLLSQGETEFVEVGYGKVLSNLVRRIDKTTSRVKAGSIEEIDAYAHAQREV